ncbi:GNAT family N-acetyltransferase [Niabella insulamsoli]|uniref:GNAT family N-acetyltransferase n=1 Tax=Niabella insulamsoli TaxID=3144874 RepID=UPI0031FCB6A0
MVTVEISKVAIDKVLQLQEIGRQTFYETFSESNTEENMKNYLENGFSIDKITAELNDENAEFYFAKIGEKIIGYLKLNFGKSQTEIKDDKALEIERIYVLKEFHGKKVGQILYDKAIEIAKQKNADYVWLGVWEQNPRAINFYKKNGFVEFDKHIFKLGEDEQTDIMMKKNIAPINIQPKLESENILLSPLNERDFDTLYLAASNPKIWEQHPNKERWKKEVFKTFFVGAIQSKGAFKIIDKSSDSVIGSTRFYDLSEQESSIQIGYTFYKTEYWGRGTNNLVKTLMLDYIFNYVSKVYFHIGANNIRSQKAIVKLGALKVGEQEVTYFGEKPMQNFVYELTYENWKKKKAAANTGYK